MWIHQKSVALMEPWNWPFFSGRLHYSFRHFRCLENRMKYKVMDHGKFYRLIIKTFINQLFMYLLFAMLFWVFFMMIQRSRLLKVKAAWPKNIKNQFLWKKIKKIVTFWKMEKLPSRTCVTCCSKFWNSNGVKNPREPRWKAMTGGTDCWNRDDAYNSVPSPPRQTEEKNWDLYSCNKITTTWIQNFPPKLKQLSFKL